jgi:hypothetical protein
MVHGRDGKRSVMLALLPAGDAPTGGAGSWRIGLPTSSSTYKENRYGIAKSSFAAGAFGPAPIPTLRLSLVDCEI